ncbi:MAG: deoxyribodipyrimidine photo-lyase [Chitinophagaceae bacterium]|nr:MAG: deoxyribodipyrimidine photo-lyase [Chitinophagaceae bacterium]
MKPAINLFWFRRDLRLQDNTGLYHALRSGVPVLPIFIFDTLILNQLENKKDARVQFIYDTLKQIKNELELHKCSLYVFHGSPMEAFKKLTATYNIEAVFTNNDYEPYAIQRDNAVKDFLQKKNIAFHSFKDHVIFEKLEVQKDDGTPYTVFTPYSRKWKALRAENTVNFFPSEKNYQHLFETDPLSYPALHEIGFDETEIRFPKKKVESDLIENYAKQRDFPGKEATSRLGIHFRFGTISIRKAVARAEELSAVFLSELIWREFYQMILFNFPHVAEGKSFKPAYDKIMWRVDSGEFEKWCEGQTGYPIVDAGMRQLNSTGFMHNRVRMIVASFLCKHLLLDWRLGEAYFAEKLLDYDFAANNGGWQWAAGSGCDAAPYFRVFNPYLQTKKFDPNLNYIKKWVPEFESSYYPSPIVEHNFARERCLATYAAALKKS